MRRKIALVLAVLLFVCLAPMPYGYYQLVRLIAAVVFGYFAVVEFGAKRATLAILFLLLALVFQPFMKVALGRGIWNILDIIAGVGLLFYAKNQK